MKVHANQTELENKVTLVENTCCSSTISNTKKEDPCCEQPNDGSSCCDKSLSKEENSKALSCC